MDKIILLLMSVMKNIKQSNIIEHVYMSGKAISDQP